jgi:hypothetical protein
MKKHTLLPMLAISTFGLIGSMTPTAYAEGTAPRSPLVAVAATPDGGDGFWAVDANGRVGCSHVACYGQVTKRLNQPVVDIVPTPDASGYWLTAADGGVFAFGDAHYYGSMAGQPLNKPIVAMAATPDGKGYWLLGRDGGVFAFGDAPYYGPAFNLGNAYAVTIDNLVNHSGYIILLSNGRLEVLEDGNGGYFSSVPDSVPYVGFSWDLGQKSGYWLVDSVGRVIAFAGAPGFINLTPFPSPVVGLASTKDGNGLFLPMRNGTTIVLGDAA